MDTAQIGGLLAGGAALGGIIGAFGNHLYARGRRDAAAKNADLTAAASILRLEMSLSKLSDTVSAHVTEDAGNFGAMKAGIGAMEKAVDDMRETMRDAADGMRALTERLDRVISGR